MGHKFYDSKELAEILEISERTLRRMVLEGKIPAHLFGKNYVFCHEELVIHGVIEDENADDDYEWPE